MINKLLFLGFLLVLGLRGYWCLGQTEIPLYTGDIPNATGASDEEFKKVASDGEILIYKVSVPSLTVFLPPVEKANGTAVIICPGGGYGVQVSKREGSDVARKFNERGIAAFVLKYRLPDDKFIKDKSIGPLQDAQKAIQLVRDRSAEWHINPQKIGIMGFSAGGHLASTAGTHFHEALISNQQGLSLRPDFMLLIYPVISFSDRIGHGGTRKNLLGTNPSSEQVLLYSNELHAGRDTPPAFLIHGSDDSVVPVSNSVVFYTALQQQGVSSGLFIYPKGEHGFLKSPPFDEWFGRCLFWMKSMELLP